VAELRLFHLTDGLFANKHFEGAYLWVTLRGKMKCQNIQSSKYSPFLKAISLATEFQKTETKVVIPNPHFNLFHSPEHQIRTNSNFKPCIEN